MRRLACSARMLVAGCSGGDTAPTDASLDAFEYRDADVDGSNELRPFGAPMLIAEGNIYIATR